jgi:transitional endoplasmic reticulum ATPase
MLAIEEHISRHQDPKEAESNADEMKVSLRHIEEAMRKIRPLSKQELDWYKTVAQQFGKPRIIPAEMPRAGIS